LYSGSYKIYVSVFTRYSRTRKLLAPDGQFSARAVSRYRMSLSNYAYKVSLLIIAKEDLHWKPAIAADLESVLEVAERLDLLRSQLPSVKLEVLLDSRLRY